MFGTELFEEVLTEQQQIEYGNTAAVEQENMDFEGQNPLGASCD